MAPFSINYFGSTIPFNPDALPERKFLFGQGSPRPVGLTEQQMVKLYWTVRSFQVNITASLLFDAFLAFLSGATTGTIIGTTVGLNAAADILRQGGGNLFGKTKINNFYTIKNRVLPTPFQNSLPTPGLAEKCKGKSNFQYVASRLQPFHHSVELNPEADKKYLTGRQSNVNEGVLCGAGPVHVLQTGNSRIEINFTDILYAKRLYWPTIIIDMPLITSSLYTLNPLGQTTNFAGQGVVIGGINFVGSVINLYSTSPSAKSYIFTFGDVNIDPGCCSRFYYDGKDEERVRSYCKAGCAELGFKG